MLKGMKSSKGKSGSKAGKGKRCQSMDLLHFFKPKTQLVKPITLADRKSEDFETPVKKKQRYVDEGKEVQVEVETRGGGEGKGEEEKREIASFSVSTPIAGADPHGTPVQEEKNVRKGFLPHSSLTRLGTPAQTYRRRKRVVKDSDGSENQSLGESDSNPHNNSSKKHDVADATGTAKLRQVYLDLGQSNFGHTKCPVCGLLYTVGEPSDEKAHKQFHRKFLNRSSNKPTASSAQNPTELC